MCHKNDVTAIEDKIKEIIVTRLNLATTWGVSPKDISSEAPLFDEGLGLSSVAALEIIIGLEDAFDIEFKDADIDFEVLYSVRNLANHVAGKLAAQ